jgi:hypothetical protein
MVVFSNHWLGPSAELLVSPEVATTMLRATASAARPLAENRWENELVSWLEERAADPTAIDVGDIAWSPDHFDMQRHFVTDAIKLAAMGSEHETALRRWAKLIESHPRHCVRFASRWIRQRSLSA